MKKIGKWLDRPVTWRTSLKVSGITMAVYLVFIAVYYSVNFWDRILDKLDTLTRLVKGRKNRV